MTLDKLLVGLFGGLPYAGGGLFLLLTLVELAPIKVLLQQEKTGNLFSAFSLPAGRGERQYSYSFMPG